MQYDERVIYRSMKIILFIVRGEGGLDSWLIRYDKAGSVNFGIAPAYHMNAGALIILYTSIRT